MRTGLRVEDLGDLLEQPFVAVLATLRADGSVLLSPVWHEWRDGAFHVWVGEQDVKTRHLRRDPRASIVVAESAPPLRGIEVRGSAELIEGGALEAAVAIASRYIGPERAAAYVGSAGSDSLIARIAPGDLRVWDFADEYGSMSS
ncbi:MAG: TIGR03618 family F420-dependent PPOX class oxidoreductase [Actinobacteria bacterium]|nr:TIGR03618 family F420-dependent PPOX class oxidoreductase [Actinomycetota bacterium]